MCLLIELNRSDEGECLDKADILPMLLNVSYSFENGCLYEYTCINDTLHQQKAIAQYDGRA